MLNLHSLVIEVTRKCNMKCEHCLRGAAQRKTISDQHIYKMLQLIDNVSHLTITGGEPTLAQDALNQIQHCITYGNCDVGSFYMVTNGKAINVETVAQWAYDMDRVCSDNDSSGISFSFDNFHTRTLNCQQEDKQARNYRKIQEIMEWNYGLDDSFVRKHTDRNFDYNRLVSEGRAKDIGSRDVIKEYFAEDDYYDDDDDVYFGEGVLYLSSNGNIVAGCDWSYHNIDNRKDIFIAHIDDIRCTDDLIEAIRAYTKRTEDKAKELLAN